MSLLKEDEETPVLSEPVQKEYEDGNLKVHIGPDSYAIIHELDGFESLKADAMVTGNLSPLVMIKLYAVFSVSKLVRKGQPVVLAPTKNDLEVWNRARQFTGRELMVIMDAYANEFMGSPLDDKQLKNESSPQPE